MPLILKKSDDIKFCVVLGCKNAGHELKQWMKSRCASHQNKLKGICGCPAPFTLYQFPKEPKLRKIWLGRIGLPQLGINDSTCICSIHFLEGSPTTKNQLPSLFLQSSELSDSDDDESVDDIITNDDPLDHVIDEDKEYADTKRLQYVRVEHNDADECKSESKCIEVKKENFGEDSEEEMVMLSRSGFGIEAMELKMEDACKYKNENIDGQDDETIQEQEQHADSIVSDIVEPLQEAKSTQSDSQPPDDDDDVEFLFLSRPQTKPVASYDPQAQILQISNPVKYIQECHTRIAQLLAQNEQQKKDFEKSNLKLTLENKSLKRKLSAALSRRVATTMDSSRFRVVNKKGTNKVVVIRKGKDMS